jgi:hypothetical protein
MSEPRIDHANRPMAGGISRREFLQAGSAAIAAAGLGGAVTSSAGALARGLEEAKDLGPIPRAVLGRTGVEVSILGLGTADLGHQNGNNPPIPELVRVFSDAVDRGVTYVDTGRIYGGAEEALSEVLKSRRDRVFLATKCMENTREAAQKSFETSLKTLKVDHVDVLHLHSTGDRDLDEVLKPGGLWDYFLEQKKAGKTRFLGITGHSRPLKFLRMLATDQVDVMMVAMNFVDRHVYGFEEKVLPKAREKKVGVLAMKVFGGIVGGFRNYQSKKPFPSQMDPQHHFDSIRYAKSLEGVTGMVIGVHSSEQLHRNIELVLKAKPLSKEEFDALCEKGKALAPQWTARFGPAA